MTRLAINTASSKTAIALFDEGHNLLFEKSWQSQNDEAEKLMPEIDAALTGEGLKFSDIDGVFVVKGPGSFTGLRIGVTVANTIAYLNECDLFAVDTFEYWWEAWKGEANISDGAAESMPDAMLVFAGKGGVYLSRPGKDVEIVNLEDLNEKLKSAGIKTVFGDISDEQKAILEGVEFVEVEESFGGICGRLLGKKLESVKMVVPLYVKNPGITESRKSLFG